MRKFSGFDHKIGCKLSIDAGVFCVRCKISAPLAEEANILENEQFTIAFRGYEKEEVDRVLAELRAELEHVREYNYSASSEVEMLKAEIEALKTKAKKNAAPGYAELGAQFEQTLRLAEEQAKKLVSDAGQDAIRIRETAKAESEQLTRKAQAKADKLISEAETKLNESRLDAERLAAEILSVAKTRESEAAEKIGTAQREAAAIKSEGERYAAEMRAQVHRETEEARALATELSQKTAQARVELEAEVRAKRDEAEQEGLRLYQTAVTEAQAVTDEANTTLAEASARAAQLISEADRISREAQEQSAQLIEDSNRTATNLINQSRRRSEALTRKAEYFANATIRESEERLSRMKSERVEIEEFLGTLRNMMTTESMVAADENSAAEQD
ncbi:MAG: hypothetical protein RLZZ258_195 [Actinomycetota bacterium]